MLSPPHEMTLTFIQSATVLAYAFTIAIPKAQLE